MNHHPLPPRTSPLRKRIEAAARQPWGVTRLAVATEAEQKDAFSKCVVRLARLGLLHRRKVPGHAPRELPVVCGHWSTLGLFMGLGIYAIDTGAVWGGKLTALELGQELRLHQVAGREVPANEVRRRA